jgi:magnesium transporter
LLISSNSITYAVTPTYYVICLSSLLLFLIRNAHRCTTVTFFSIVTTIVLFKGLSAPPAQIITLVMGFLVISVGIAVLQLSKMDPTSIKSMRGLDRRSTMLLQATQAHTAGVDEKDPTAIEEPGIDALRGSFGTVGSIIRARTARRMSMSSGKGSTLRSRHGRHPSSGELPHYNAMGGHGGEGFVGMKRHQLYDPPMPDPALSPRSENISVTSQTSPRLSERKMPTIKFGNEDIVHSYPVAGHDGQATHEHRSAVHGLPAGAAAPYPSVCDVAEMVVWILMR